MGAKDEDKLRRLKDAARNETNPVKKKLLQKIAAQQQNLTDIAEAENKKVEAEDALRKLMAATGGVSKKLLEEQRMAVVNATQALNKTVMEEKPKVLDLDGRSEVSVLHPDEGGPKSGVEEPSMSGCLASSSAVAPLTEPPYWMRRAAATSSDTFSFTHSRITRCVSCAISGVAESPVPIAHTGSYAITTLAQTAGSFPNSLTTAII